jgi:hypothetical protein
MDVQIFAKVEPKLREKIDIVKLLELSNSRNGIVDDDTAEHAFLGLSIEKTVPCESGTFLISFKLFCLPSC